MTKKRIKIKTVIEAIRKNGLPKAQGSYFKYNGTEIESACAFGQASLNLGVSPGTLSVAMDTYIYDKKGYAVKPDIRSIIIDANDRTEQSLKEIADRIEIGYEQYMDDYITLVI